jgi:hypothetical protein
VTEWHPKMTRELLPGRSVHDWDRIHGTLTRIGLPGWLVSLGLIAGGLVASQSDSFVYGPWVWWVLGVVGFPAWLAGGVWILGGRMVLLYMQERAALERAAGYSTSRYAPNFMTTPPEIDHVDGESGRIVRLADEPWLTEPEYEARLRAVRGTAVQEAGTPEATGF